MVYNWLNRLQQSLYPPTCVLCGAEGADRRDLCGGCHTELPHNKHCCVVCALPLPAEGHGQVCGRCTRKRPLFDQCLAAFHYSDPADELVLDLKFRQRLVCARLLGELLGDYLLIHRAAAPLPRILIPVPLHPRRLRERGFNQAIELARPIAKRLGIPLAHSLCRRDRLTPLQTGLSALARRRNLRGAFSVSGSIQTPHVALIDDVVTTGSTANELARLLKRNGVERVELWAACRTPQPQPA
jgi:ComF family protein